MHSETNPAELYSNTTWERLDENSGLGSNSYLCINTSSDIGAKNTNKDVYNRFYIEQRNLPYVDIIVDEVTPTIGTFKTVASISKVHTASYSAPSVSGAFYTSNHSNNGRLSDGELCVTLNFDSSRSGATSGSFGNIKPTGHIMGGDEPIELDNVVKHYVIRAWRRLS